MGLKSDFGFVDDGSSNVDYGELVNIFKIFYFTYILFLLLLDIVINY